MKTRLLISFSLAPLFALITGPVSLAQGLLSNPGFESFTTCPTGVAQLPNALPHSYILGHGGTVDYMNACNTGLVGVPNNIFGNQAAHNGDGYIGITLYYASNPNFREYVCTPLSSPMVPGTTYRIELYASLADNVQNSTDDLQFYFSTGCPIWGGGWSAMTSYTPQAVLASGSYINDRTNWVYYSVDVVATAAWTNMTMGNFLDDAGTSVQFVSPATYTSAYIYVDDWSMYPVMVMDADLTGPEISGDQTARIDWETSRETGTSNWQVQKSVGDASHFETIATIDAAGNSSDTKHYSFTDEHPVDGKVNYYRLALVDEDGSTTYSKTVSLAKGSIGDWLQLTGSNPVQKGDMLSANVSGSGDTDITAEVVDMSGRITYSQTLAGSAGDNGIHIPTEGMNAGSYLLVVARDGERESKRFVVMDY